MSKLGDAQLGATVIFASSHPHESCGSNGLPLTPNSIKILGRFQFLKTLQHPHLCKYISIVRGKHERLIIIAEYYKENVKEISKLNNFSSSEIVRIAYETLQGLTYLNKHGKIHRCLSPDKILLDKKKRVKLTKYGLYHMTDGGSCVSFPIGVPRYLAPEVLLISPTVVSDHVTPPVVQALGPKVDVWSLGIILAELALGVEFWTHLSLKEIFMKILTLSVSGSSSALNILAEEHHVTEKLKDLPNELVELIRKCLTINPKDRLTPEQLLEHPVFCVCRKDQDEKAEHFFNNWSLLSTELRCQYLDLNNVDGQLADDHLSERSLEEVYYLWQLAGGDLDVELKRQGIVKSKPPICSLPKVVIEEGEFFGQKKDRAFLLDETFITLPLDQLRERLNKIKPEAFYPLIEDSVLGDEETNEAASLPLVIREKDIEYQFHRIVLYERLLKGYPYKRQHIIKEAKIDIPPLYRAHIWGALLDIEGDIYTRYDSIDKETQTVTDRQIEVDIPRCHQYDELLSSPEGHRKFKRLLKAWVVSHPQYVYWQGLDSLCAPFLYLNFNDEGKRSKFKIIITTLLFSIITKGKIISFVLLLF